MTALSWMLNTKASWEVVFKAILSYLHKCSRPKHSLVQQQLLTQEALKSCYINLLESARLQGQRKLQMSCTKLPEVKTVSYHLSLQDVPCHSLLTATTILIVDFVLHVLDLKTALEGTILGFSKSSPWSSR